MTARVAVIGAGFSGLAAALELKRSGLEPVVFEAAPHVGGTIRSVVDGGYLCETGPSSLLDREPALAALLSSLGLGPRVVAAAPAAKRRCLLASGRLVPLPMSPPAFVASPLLPPAAKLRVLAEPLVPRGPGGEETVAAFMRRRFGPEVARTVADAFVAGVFAGDSERLSMRSAFPRLVELERAHGSVLRGLLWEMRRWKKERRGTGQLISFDGGLQILVDAMARELGEAVQLASPVESVFRDGDGVRLVLGGRHGRRELRAQAAVVALPAPGAAAVLRAAAPGASGVLETIPYAPVAVVHLGYRAAEAGRSSDAFGYLAPKGEPSAILGCIFSSTIFPGRAPKGHALLTAFVGGMRDPERVRQPETQLAGVAAEELSRVLGAGAPVFRRVVRHERAIPQYEVGHGARLAALDAVLAGVPGVFLAGNAYRGVGVADCAREAPQVARQAALYARSRSAA